MYSMQSQTIISRALLEYPSTMELPLDPANLNISRWEYIRSQLTLLREQVTHDATSGSREEALAGILDQLLPELDAGIAQAEESPTLWENEEHPALVGLWKKMQTLRELRDTMRGLLRDAWDMFFAERDLAFQLSSKKERVRMKLTARRIRDRIATQQHANEWARERAGHLIELVNNLEKLTWKREGAKEDMGTSTGEGDTEPKGTAVEILTPQPTLQQKMTLLAEQGKTAELHKLKKEMAASNAAKKAAALALRDEKRKLKGLEPKAHKHKKKQKKRFGILPPR